MEEHISPENQEKQAAEVSSAVPEPVVPEEPKAEDLEIEEKTEERPEEKAETAEIVEKKEPEEEVKEPEEEVKEGEATVESPAPATGDRKWYIIQTFTGQEDKVKQAIELTIKDENLQSRVFQVLVPTEDTVEIKGGKRLEKVRKMFPGYVFLEMVLDEETWHLIRQTTGVARFIGTKVTPTAVADKEMQRVLKQLGKEEKLEVTFEKGEGVRVISGPFRGYTGSVDEINAEKGKLKILINIFGRDTPVEVNFEHAQKIV